MDAQINLAATPASNFHMAPGLMVNALHGQLADNYVREATFLQNESPKYATYDIQKMDYFHETVTSFDDQWMNQGNALSLSNQRKRKHFRNKNVQKRTIKRHNWFSQKRLTNDETIISKSGDGESSQINKSVGENFITGNDNTPSGNINKTSPVIDKEINNKNKNNNIYNSTLVNLLWSSSQTPAYFGADYTNINNNNIYNKNSNNNSSGPSSISTNYIIIFSTLFFLIGTIGISGNMLVVYIVLSDCKMRRSMTNMMILNLALADSLIMVFGVPEIVMVLLDKGWQLGGVACSVNRTILVCALYASVLTLVAVCIERYIAIVFPIKAHILCTKRRVLFVIGFIWLFSMACSSPTAIFNTVVQISNTQFCLTKFHDNRTKHDLYLRIFKYTESALFYIGPLIIQVVCYAVIGKRLFVDLDKLHRGGGGGGGISSASRPNGRGPTRAFNEARRARKGVVKMLMASVAIYCLSYSPHQILLVYNTFSSLTFDETWIYLVFTTILAYVNSAANPFLYCVFSDNFRTNFKRILHTCVPCRFCCCSETCSSCFRCHDAKTPRPMKLHSYTEYTSLVRRNTQKQGQAPVITV